MDPKTIAYRINEITDDVLDYVQDTTNEPLKPDVLVEMCKRYRELAEEVKAAFTPRST